MRGLAFQEQGVSARCACVVCVFVFVCVCICVCDVDTTSHTSRLTSNPQVRGVCRIPGVKE